MGTAVARTLVRVVVGFLLATRAGTAVAADEGKTLYRRYCAACHGPEGRGDGPAASTFKTPPSDLTTIAARAGGTYPLADVMAVIDGRRAVAAHGTRDMPVWGERLRETLAGEPYPERTTLQQVQLLAEWLRELQRTPAPR